MNIIDTLNIDKSQFMVLSLDKGKEPENYWHLRTPLERLQAIEIMRNINYGKDVSTRRLQSVFEVTQRS